MMRCRVSRLLHLAITFLIWLSAVAPLSPVSAQDSSASAISGNSYDDPFFGYEVTWDEEVWTPVDEYSSWDYSMLGLQGPASYATVEGLYSYLGNPELCLNLELGQIARELGVGELVPREDADGQPMEGVFEDNAIGLYPLPDGAMGEGLTTVLYLDCRTLIPGYAVVVQTMYLDQSIMDAMYSEQATGLVSLTLSAEPPAEPDLAEFSEYMWSVIADIEEFWTDTYAELDYTFESPTYENIAFPYEDDCLGPAATLDVPTYCYGTGLLRLSDEAFMTGEMYLPGFMGFWEFTLGHELGHHIWFTFDLGECAINDCNTVETLVSSELMANCLSAAWMQDSFASGFFDEPSQWRILRGIWTVFELAEDDGVHGTGEQQRAAFDLGYEGGFAACVGA